MTQFKVKFTFQQASKLDSLENVQRLHQDAKLSNMNEKESRCRYSLLEFCYLKPNMTWREKTRIMTKHLVLWPFQQYVDNLEEIIDCAQAIFGFDQSIHLKLWPNSTHPAPPPPHEHHQLSEKSWATLSPQAPSTSAAPFHSFYNLGIWGSTPFVLDSYYCAGEGICCL